MGIKYILFGIVFGLLFSMYFVNGVELGGGIEVSNGKAGSLIFDNTVESNAVHLNGTLENANFGFSFWVNESEYVSSKIVHWDEVVTTNSSALHERFTFYDVNNSVTVSAPFDLGNFTSTEDTLRIYYTFFTDSQSYNWEFSKANHNTTNVPFTFNLNSRNNILTFVRSTLTLGANIFYEVIVNSETAIRFESLLNEVIIPYLAGNYTGNSANLCINNSGHVFISESSC